MDNTSKINTENNFLQHFLYKLALPMVFLFRFLKITPNQVTFLSVLINLISSYFLVYGNLKMFLLLWYTSHFLDYCDGSLARLTGNTTKVLFRIDHYSDLLKIFSTIIAVCCFYVNPNVWLAGFIFIFLFMMYNIISLDASNFNKANKGSLILDFKNKSPLFFRHLYNIIFTLNGHTLFLFGFLVLNVEWAMGVLFYLILIIIKSIYSPLLFLLKNYRLIKK